MNIFHLTLIRNAFVEAMMSYLLKAVSTGNVLLLLAGIVATWPSLYILVCQFCYQLSSNCQLRICTTINNDTFVLMATLYSRVEQFIEIKLF